MERLGVLRRRNEFSRKRVIRSYIVDSLDIFESGAPTLEGSRVSESIEKTLRKIDICMRRLHVPSVPPDEQLQRVYEARPKIYLLESCRHLLKAIQYLLISLYMLRFGEECFVHRAHPDRIQR